MNEGELELRLYKLKEKMKTRRVVIESPAGLLSRIRERTSMKEEDNISRGQSQHHQYEIDLKIKKDEIEWEKQWDKFEAREDLERKVSLLSQNIWSLDKETKKADKKMMIIIVVGVGLLFLIALLSARAMG